MQFITLLMTPFIDAIRIYVYIGCMWPNFVFSDVSIVNACYDGFQEFDKSLSLSCKQNLSMFL